MKRMLTLAAASCLALSLGVPAIAVEGNDVENTLIDHLPVNAVETEQYEAPLEEEDNQIQIIVNDAVLSTDIPVQVMDEVSYVSYQAVVSALYPNATAEWVDDRALVLDDGLTLEIPLNVPYFIANGRYLYLPQGVAFYGENILLPVRPLCAALGADVAWDPIGENIVITAGTGPIPSGDVAYQEDVLYWLSHIINAEAGNQPLAGKIAVGNVVLNRVASSQFPNTVYEVIHQRNQFTPVANGSINRTPNEESVIAAKLCMDGANTVENALYFMNPRTSSSNWMAKHCSYVTTIAQHDFYA